MTSRLGDVLCRARQHVVGGPPGGDDEDGAVRPARDDGRVGDRERGRRIDDDDHVVRELPGERLHALRPHHLARVRRRPSGCDHEEPAVLVDLVCHLLDLGASGQHVRQADIIGEPEHAAEDRTPQVGIDEDDGLTRRGDAHGEVRGRRRLAVSGERTGDDHDPGRTVDVDVLEVRAQFAHGLLVRERAAAILDVVEGEHRAPARQFLIDGEDADDRGVDGVRDVTNRTHTSIECPTHEREDDSRHSTRERAQGDVEPDVRRRRRGGQTRRVPRHQTHRTLSAAARLELVDLRRHPAYPGLREIARGLRRGAGGIHADVDGVDRVGDPDALHQGLGAVREPEILTRRLGDAPPVPHVDERLDLGEGELVSRERGTGRTV